MDRTNKGSARWYWVADVGIVLACFVGASSLGWRIDARTTVMSTIALGPVLYFIVTSVLKRVWPQLSQLR